MKEIYEIIERRSSVRDYALTPLTAAQREALERACAEAAAPFGGRVYMCLTVAPEGADVARPGTYGVIHGATEFLVLATDGSDEALLSAGYAFERVVLEATRLGLGTCWMAVTFRSSSFAAYVPEGMTLAAVSPVGVASGKRHMLERITRTFVRETHRVDFDRLFSCGTFGTAVPRDSRFVRPLEAVRRAPSSVNSQPWAALVDADGRRVYFYSRKRSSCLQLDMGIALCHFALACEASGIEGAYEQAADAPAMPSGRYFTTFCVKNGVKS